MACLLVPAAEAVVTTVVGKAVESKEKKSQNNAENITLSEIGVSGRIPFSRKIKWLSNLLWGGSAMLLFEHIWHGEIVPYAPFLTGAMNPADTAAMLHEMSTVGVTMAGLVTLLWGGMVVLSGKKEKEETKAKL